MKKKSIIMSQLRTHSLFPQFIFMTLARRKFYEFPIQHEYKKEDSGMRCNKNCISKAKGWEASGSHIEYAAQPANVKVMKTKKRCKL